MRALCDNLVSREDTVTTPPSRPPRSWNGEGEVCAPRAAITQNTICYHTKLLALLEKSSWRANGQPGSGRGEGEKGSWPRSVWTPEETAALPPTCGCLVCCGAVVLTGSLKRRVPCATTLAQVLIALGAVHAGVLAWFVAAPKGENDPG